MFSIPFSPTMSKLVARFAVKNRKRLFLGGAFAAVGLLGFVFVSAGSVTRNETRTNTRVTAAAIPTPRLYVRPEALWPRLRWNFRALGNRLEHPGKEQILIYGTLTRAGIPAPTPVVLNMEIPNRMTLTIQNGISAQVTQFDGTDSSWMALAPAERDVVETLLFDTAESFFFSQTKGSATRFLGFRFRPNAQNTTGPFHDVYAVAPSSTFTSNTQGAKLFYFNSDTLLLDAVRYRVERKAGPVQVQVKLTNWTVTDGQQVAWRVERWDDGMNVLTLVVNKVVFAPKTTGIQQ